jgi:uncharacterized repeat protein (TIGR03803 family)
VDSWIHRQNLLLLAILSFPPASAHAGKSDTYQTIYDIQGSPYRIPSTGAPILAKDGYIYGTTINSENVVFRVAPDGSGYKVVYDFTGQLSGLNFLVEGKSGTLYGTSFGGGDHGQGALFSLTKKGKASVLYSFTGTAPDGPITIGSDGRIYGTQHGNVYAIDLKGNYQDLHDFGDVQGDGEFAQGGVIQAPDGFFYGTTLAGGASNDGTIYRVAADGTYTLLYSFTGGSDGAGPEVGLLYCKNKFYGIASSTIFSFSLGDGITALHQLSQSEALNPLGGLVKGSGSWFYDAGHVGGSMDRGTIFKINATGKFALVHDFTGNGSDGAYPSALSAGHSGTIFGMGEAGGLYGMGVVFSVTP